MTPILDRLLWKDLFHRRMGPNGSFSRPLMHARGVLEEEAPFLVSDRRGRFIWARRRPDETLWAGFFQVERAEEDGLLPFLWEALWRESVARNWANRSTNLGDATSLMVRLGQTPCCLVLSEPAVREMTGLPPEEIEALMKGRGFVVQMDKIYILCGSLTQGTAMVTAAPKDCGSYVRSDRDLALTLHRIDRVFVLVRYE